MWRRQEGGGPVSKATEPCDAVQQTRALRAHARDMINQLSTIAHRLTELEASRTNSSASLLRRPSTTDPQGAKRFLRMTAAVDQERCTCCGLCVDSCPERAIQMNGDAVTIESSLCTGCGSCVTECPNEAISLSDTLRRAVL